MPAALDRILGYAADPSFADAVLDLVAETTHDRVLADHILAALLSRTTWPEYRQLVRMGRHPDLLRSLILENLPLAPVPLPPPARVTVESLDPSLVERCNASDDAGSALLASLTEEVRDVLRFGSLLEPLAAAFTQEEQAAPFVGPAFFGEDGLLSHGRFRGNALALLEEVERASAELGYQTISLPQLFVGAARHGLLKNFLAGFARSGGAVLDGIARSIGKTPLAKPPSFAASSISSTVKRYVEQVETLARERRSEVFDEVLLVTALCDQESELLAGYWRTLAVDRRMAARTIGTMKDDSPIGARSRKTLPDFRDILQRLTGRVVGQREPIHQIMDLVKRWMAGVRFPEQPAGVVMLMGPSGVGKTELSKELADLLFGDRRKLCFIEMNTMTTEVSINRLIGSPPGYVGMGEGVLTKWLEQNPESLVLFDEVEKAHPKCFDAMLRLLSEGRLQDGCGKELDGTGALIVLTSNLGQNAGVFEAIAAEREAGRTESAPVKDPRIRELLSTLFNPEHIGRLEHVVLFNPLTEADYREIAGLACEKTAKHLSQALGLRIHVEAGSDDVMAREAVALSQGARGLRILAQSMTAPLVSYRQEQPDQDEVTVAFEGDRFVVRG